MRNKVLTVEKRVKDGVCRVEVDKQNDKWCSSKMDFVDNHWYTKVSTW